jgi:pyruvate dehydrogenase E1 component
VREGILKGLYKLKPAARPGKRPRVHLFGSGPLIQEALRAQELLRERYNVAADVWSVTSYNELYRDALACSRWNRLHPDVAADGSSAEGSAGVSPAVPAGLRAGRETDTAETAVPPAEGSSRSSAGRVPYITQVLQNEPWPIVSTSDYVSSVAERLCPWTPAGMCVLGTDGFGRSDTRPALRRHFEIDAEHVVLAALTELARTGQFDRNRLAEVMQDLDIDPEAPDPAKA